MNKPPEGGTKDASGVIVSMTEQEQAEWIAWRDSLDPNKAEDARWIKLLDLGTEIYNVLTMMVGKMEAARKLQNGGAQ